MRGNLARARRCGADRRLSVPVGGRNAGADSQNGAGEKRDFEHWERNGAGEKRDFERWERNGGADERLYSARRRILDTGNGVTRECRRKFARQTAPC